MKISIVGAGNAACVTALSYHLQGRIRGNEIGEIEIYYDPSVPIEKVGQGTLPLLTGMISQVLGINHYQKENKIEATLKSGILYENWGKKTPKHFHPFLMNTTSIHYVPNLLSKAVLESGLFNVVEKNIEDPEEEIDSDLIFDCRGGGDRNKHLYKELISPVNSVLLYNKKGRDPDLLYTRCVATPHGWTFVIPNMDSVSYGYLYNDTITSTQAARHDFIERFNLPDDSTTNISFENYVAKNLFVGERTILNGNRYSFLEPLEATSTGLYQSVCRYVWDYIEGNMTKTESEYHIKRVVKQIETFILWHYQFGSKYDTPFWKYAKSLPFEPDSYFNEFIEKSKLESYFELESKPRCDEDYYGEQWTYSTFRYWYDGV